MDQDDDVSGVGPAGAVSSGERWIEPYLTGSDSVPLKEDLDVTVVKAPW
jgi:hypothetical protein